MKFIDYTVNTGKKNMLIDSDLLESAINKNSQEPVLRLYGWSPACISLGRNQDDSFLDKDFLSKNNIDFTRRLTGGRALLHDNEITYSFIIKAASIPNGENVQSSYKSISGIWIDIFKNLGIDLTIGGCERHISHNNYCMSISTGADLCYKNKKFIGSAQCRKNGYILQHGSILFDYNKSLIDEIFRENTDFNNIVTLKEINQNISPEMLVDAVKSFVKTSVDY